MRLRLLILLLVLLPLQQTWAAMGPYCGDVRTGAALSVAALCCDHTIPEAGTAARPDPNATRVIGHAAGEADCGTCHANGSAALMTVGALPLFAGLAPTPDGMLATPRPVPAHRPERPQWRALV